MIITIREGNIEIDCENDIIVTQNGINVYNNLEESGINLTFSNARISGGGLYANGIEHDLGNPDNNPKEIKYELVEKKPRAIILED